MSCRVLKNSLTLTQDPELWYPDGNCLVHLHERGHSRRGPAFKIPMEALLATNCKPLLNRFLLDGSSESPISDVNSENGSYFSAFNSKTYELYIPAPATADRRQAFLYHTATRNFFAWIFGKPLVGSNLGPALVGLLKSMNEFRYAGEDNIQEIMDYMDEEGYADMRNQPDHALAILYFAEHFQFRDLWIDAFAHCTGMNEKLYASPGFEMMSRTSRALTTRSRIEMDLRLDHCGRRLASFLSDDLSEAYLGLPSAARAHLDTFRCFLQSYYVAKLGYYPPESPIAGSAAFPKNIYRQMCSEFQRLYEFLVDSQFTYSDCSPSAAQGGICVLQSIQSFDARHKYPSLLNPLPLLPEVEEFSSPRQGLSKRMSWVPHRTDKMKPDPRLVTFSSLSKATNRGDPSLQDCSLVRAYRGFEKDCIFSPSKADRHDKLSQTDARKVRWILIYSVLQTLLSATNVPEQVRDTQNVPYNLCVLTAGCPPWKDEKPYETLLRTQTDQTREDFHASLMKAAAASTVSAPPTPEEIKPDIDYFAITHRFKQDRANTAPILETVSTTKRGTITKARSTLGNMPELWHPRPERNSQHEILVHGYGNGTDGESISAARPATPVDDESPRKRSLDSPHSSTGDVSSRWSHSTMDAASTGSPRSSVSSRRDSNTSVHASKSEIQEFLDRPMCALGLSHRGSSAYSMSVYEESLLQPDPLQVKKPESDCNAVAQEAGIDWADGMDGEPSEELRAYLNA